MIKVQEWRKVALASIAKLLKTCSFFFMKQVSAGCWMECWQNGEVSILIYFWQMFFLSHTVKTKVCCWSFESDSAPMYTPFPCNFGRNLVLDIMYYMHTVGLSIQTNSLVLCYLYKLPLSYSNTLEICRCGHKYTDFTEFQ